MEPTKFDELTKALATPNSRRQALRRIGGTLTGAILASWPFGQALASNSACAHFCDSVFGAGTPAASQCTSNAAHHKGLCYTCGPSSPGGTKPICCPENGSGQCTSYSSATCCTSGKTCQNGTCVTPCTANGGTCGGNSDCCSKLCDQSTHTCVSCIPTGDTGCSVGSDCCSGNCSNSVCCASGQVGLSNGSCATPCSVQDQACSGSCGNGSCNPDTSGALYCGGHTEDGPCTNDFSCSEGYFCYFISAGSGVCFALC